LSIDTNDGAANYYYGLINAQLNNVVDAKDRFDLAALSLEYRSAAYTGLSKIYLKEKNWNKALMYAAKAIDFNRYDIAAYEVQAIAYRYENDSAQAAQVLNKILSFDQLNHFARFEKYLWRQSTENQKQFTGFIQNELPSETYLELAIDYYNKGCINDAEKVLRLSPSSIIIEYWLAFIQSRRHENFSLQLEKATQSSPAFAFAFRSETAEMLQWAAQQNDNWKPKYLLALLYKDRNRIAESRELFRQLNNQPDYAPFYAARALLFWDVEKETVLADLTKALALDKQEWRYHKMLAEYYIQQQHNEKALAITESFYHSHPANYIMGMLYAKTLLLNKKYESCDQLLSRLNIIPFEGATEGRELYREAKLMQAMQQLKKQNYKKALQFIAAARNWPENLGVGKPYEQDVDERLEDWMSYYCYQQMGNAMQVQAFLQKIVSFSPRVENTVRNFIPANHLVSFWALAKTKNQQEAESWLNEEILRLPGNKTLSWVKANAEHYENDFLDADKDASMRILEQLERL
jgi:tetratricopeptide (TPR) repeat protein